MSRRKLCPRRPYRLCEDLYWYVEGPNGWLYQVRTYSYPEQPYKDQSQNPLTKVFPSHMVKLVDYVCCTHCAYKGKTTRAQRIRRHILQEYRRLQNRIKTNDDGAKFYYSYKRKTDGSVVRTRLYGRPQVPDFLYDDVTYRDDRSFLN